MKLKAALVIFLCLLLSEVKAQDPIFTQSSFILETINPSFSGFEDNGRTQIGLLHRTQWPRLGLRVNTHYAFWNKSVEKSQNFGFGFSALRQVEPISKYSLNQLNANYAHRVNLNGGWFFRPAVAVGIGYKTFNFNSLTLGDQININSETINPITVDPLISDNNNLFFFDISSGLVFEKEESNGYTYWFGASVKHLNRPNISFLEGENSPLNIFYSIHGNIRFPFLYDHGIMFSANFMQQGEFNRLDIGSLIQINQFLFGITAATNPAKNSYNSHLLTSVNSFIGLEYTDFRFGVSYDFNTSKIGNTNGVYELSITYLSRCKSCGLDRSRKH